MADTHADRHDEGYTQKCARRSNKTYYDRKSWRRRSRVGAREIRFPRASRLYTYR